MPKTKHESTDNSAAESLLREIEQRSPFLPGGRLSRSTSAGLVRLDPANLGRAITSLLRHAMALSPIEALDAVATIDAVLDDGHGGMLMADVDVPALVAIYRDLLGDPSRHPISDLIVRLLRTADRAAILDATDGGLRDRLMEAIDAPRPRTRSFSFPTTAAEPPVEATAGAEPEHVAAGNGGAESHGGAEPEPAEAAAAPPAAPPPGAQPRTYRAYGLLESEETVLVGRPFELKVGLSPKSPPGVAGPPLELPRPDAAAYSLDIQLFADGFDLAQDESWRHSLVVSGADLYPSVVVHLTARDLPEPKATRSITATFSIEGETLGAATRQIIVTTDPTVVDTDAPATATGTNITAPTGQPPADVTITIKRGLEPGGLLWGLESSLPGIGLPDDRPTESDIGEDPQQFATAIIRKLFVQGDQLGVSQLLRGIGRTIRDEMPVAVRTALATAAAAVAPRPLDILLLTEEPYIPWELAWIDEPFDPAAPNYLGAQANIGRWMLDAEDGTTPTDPPRRVDATTMAVVSGVYASASLQRLEAAEEEAKLIQAEYRAVPIDAQPDLVYPLLGGKPPSDILHFAVHGRYDPQGPGEGIYLVSGPPIDPFQIRGSDLSMRAPFVFLNACQVGAAQNLLGNYGGIAQAFLRIGASAVVAPLWSIDDAVAQQIALEFYRRALAPAEEANGDGNGEEAERPAVADLLRQARASAGQSSTYLAYQFYGHPSLRLTWNPAPATAGSPDA